MTPVINNWEGGFIETHPLSLSPGDCKAGMFGNGPGTAPEQFISSPPASQICGAGLPLLGSGSSHGLDHSHWAYQG